LPLMPPKTPAYLCKPTHQVNIVTDKVLLVVTHIFSIENV